MTKYNQRKILFRTISIILFITLAIIGFHTYYNLTIQAKTFSEDWGRSTTIGHGENSWNPLIGSFDDYILTTAFNKDGSIDYFLLNQNGKVIKSDRIDNESIHITSKRNVGLAKNSLFFLDGGKLYQSEFDIEKGFSDTKVLFEDIEKFSVTEINDQPIIQAFNKDKIYIKKLVDDRIEDIIEIDNEWDTYDVIYQQAQNTGEVYIVHRPSKLSIELLVGEVMNGEISELKTISRRQISLNSNVNDVEVTSLMDKYYVLYEFTQVAGGRRSVYGDIRIIDKNELVEEGKVYVNSERIQGITELGEDHILYKHNSKVHIVSTAQNLRNKFSVNPDVFTVVIQEDGTLSEPKFLTNTDYYTIRPSVLNTVNGQYLVFLDIEAAGNYGVNINSNNTEYIENSRKLTKSDYEVALLKAITAPAYAFSMIIMRTGIVNMVFIVFAYLGLFFLLKLFNLKNAKLKFFLYLLIYIIINLVTFKRNFYSSLASSMMPDLLTVSFMPFIMPLVINLIAGLIAYVYAKESKKSDYFVYIVFFIIVDIYLSNVFFVPFEMIKTLAK